MVLRELFKKILTGERDGVPLWNVLLSDIGSEAIKDPADGVMVAALAENILRCGQLQPILLRKNERADGGSERYVLVAGRRRLEAMRMLGRTHVQAIVLPCDREQAEVLSLSENLLRREQHYFELAKSVVCLENYGWSLEQIAALVSLPREEIVALRKLAELPTAQVRAICLLELSKADAMQLTKLQSPVRQAVLEKLAASPELDSSELIRNVLENPDPKLTQKRKVMVSDVRVFLNTVEKSAITMRDAGFDTAISQEEDENSHTFTIRVAKRQGALLTRNEISKDVSRETSVAPKSRRRFSSALSIFEALAEEECAIGGDVSRETSMDGLTISAKNAEKLELCIDGCPKK